MTWTAILKGNANWISFDGFGNYQYGEVLFGQSELDVVWITLSIGNANWS